MSTSVYFKSSSAHKICHLFKLLCGLKGKKTKNNPFHICQLYVDLSKLREATAVLMQISTTKKFGGCFLFFIFSREKGSDQFGCTLLSYSVCSESKPVVQAFVDKIH